MGILGNILIIISALITFGLFSLIFGRRPGGDAAVGYAWSLILLGLMFLVSMILSHVVIGAKGGYEWVSPVKSTRFWIVTVGVLSAIITAAMAIFFRGDSGPAPGLFRQASNALVVGLPLLLILLFIVLLNPVIKAQLPAGLVKWSFYLACGVGVIGVSSAAASAVFGKVKHSIGKMAAREADDKENDMRMLSTIEQNDVEKNMVFLLVFTDGYKSDTVRQKALEKIYSNPRWRDEMVRYLETDWAPEAFTFFASNDVEDMEFFIPYISKGIMNQARLIRETIRRASHPSHFYEGQFAWEMERVLRTVDKFTLKGGSYLAEMKELRAAFHEPSDFDKPKFMVLSYLDQWIKDHS